MLNVDDYFCRSCMATWHLRAVLQRSRARRASSLRDLPRFMTLRKTCWPLSQKTQLHSRCDVLFFSSFSHLLHAFQSKSEVGCSRFPMANLQPALSHEYERPRALWSSLTYPVHDFIAPPPGSQPSMIANSILRQSDYLGSLHSVHHQSRDCV